MRVLLILLVSGWISACGTLQIEEKNFIRPDSLSGASPKGRLDQAGLQSVLPDAILRELSVPVAGGVNLRGVLVQRPNALASVLYFGGSGFHLDDGAKVVASRLSACQVNMLVFDYRGYGRSDGMPTVANMQQDALTLFDHVNAQFPGQVLVHGHSLGSFVAAYVAQNRPVRGLVLEATANNALEWAHANVPWYASAFVDLQVSESLKEIDNARALTQFTQPSLVLAGGLDRITPARLGRKVYDAMPTAAKQIVLVDAAHHTDLLLHPSAVSAYCAMLR